MKGITEISLISIVNDHKDTKKAKIITDEWSTKNEEQAMLNELLTANRGCRKV